MSRNSAKRNIIANAVRDGVTDVHAIRSILSDKGFPTDDLEFIERRVRAVQQERNAVKIYCDGCCEPNPSSNMGIGVYSDYGIEISKRVNEYGTNNVAECLAAIAALEEAQRRGLTRFILFSDSALVCNWTTGSYKLKSATAQRYVPTIRQLLRECKAKIKWTPGSTNPADSYSRRLVGTPTSKTTTGLDYVAQAPMESLRFRDFTLLKSGFDEFSRLRLVDLCEEADEQAVAAARNAFDDDTSVAVCLRWVLRGLPVEKAIRKVKTDEEIGENVRKARASKVYDPLESLRREFT